MILKLTGQKGDVLYAAMFQQEAPLTTYKARWSSPWQWVGKANGRFQHEAGAAWKALLTGAARDLSLGALRTHTTRTTSCRVICKPSRS